MAFNDDIWDIIDQSDSASYRIKNKTKYRKRKEFRGLPANLLEEIILLTDQASRSYAVQKFGSYEGLDVHKRRLSEALKPHINTIIKPGNTSSSREDVIKVLDSFGMVNRGAGFPGYGGGFGGGMGNPMTSSGVPGQDPSRSMRASPNLWMSPYDIASITSQRGIPSVILEQKAYNILENGISIHNSKLSEKQLLAVKEAVTETQFADALVKAVYWSLAYGGSLIYPMFREDCPLTMAMDPLQLYQSGMIRKGSIERWVVLDRWNTVHVPQWNPTEKDFTDPLKYFIPYLGSDLNGKRTSRINTGPVPGYFGSLMTLGWGLSDLIGWYMSAYSYSMVAQTIPNMINQLSMVIRTVDLAGVLAMNGTMDTEEILDKTTAKMRESSVANDPITMDVLGELKTIDRNFRHVNELVRLSRQHFCAQAGVPEELILSVERGSFSSGNIVEGAMARMQHNIRLLYLSLCGSLRKAANYLIIHALGTDHDVLSSLENTTIQFHDPRVIAADTKSDIFEKMSNGVFQLVSAQVPMADAVKLVTSVGGNDIPVPDGFLEHLEKVQKELDKKSDEQHDAEMKISAGRVGSYLSHKQKEHQSGQHLIRHQSEGVSLNKTFKLGERRERHGG